jgi:cytochrome c oxidase subunit II
MLGQFDNSFWMPTQGSSYAADVDWVFYFILAISTFFFLLIAVVMIYFVIRYRRRPGHEVQPSPRASLKLELTWTIIPLILVIIIFVVGFRGYMNMATPPANAYEILVIGQKWSWAFQYPNGYVDANLHVPVNRPIELILTSRDVIHSVYIPAFRAKKDAVPGRYNRLWFQATQVNDTEGYDLFCAEYCGTSHSAMIAKVYVHEPAGFARWLEDAAAWEGRISPVERGRQLVNQRGCLQCHSIDGSIGIGPTFVDLWARTVEGQTVFRDGTRLADMLGPNYTPEQYIAESLFQPDARHVSGFAPNMPSYLGQIQENDVLALVAYFKSLSPRYAAEAETEVVSEQAPDAETQDAETQEAESDPAGATATQPAAPEGQ